MARPSSLSIIPIPQHQFPGLAITQRDFRMDFCVNNGSKSMPSMVPIYSPDYLDELLDEVCYSYYYNCSTSLYEAGILLLYISIDIR